jgi:hypothetical protein
MPSSNLLACLIVILCVFPSVYQVLVEKRLIKVHITDPPFFGLISPRHELETHLPWTF